MGVAVCLGRTGIEGGGGTGCVTGGGIGYDGVRRRTGGVIDCRVTVGIPCENPFPGEALYWIFGVVERLFLISTDAGGGTGNIVALLDVDGSTS